MTTRAGGRSTGDFTSFNLSRRVGDDAGAVAGNRHRLARELGLARAGGVAFLQQVHGIEVATIERAVTSTAPDVVGADAAVTTVQGLGLAVLAADCVPILLSDTTAGVIGVAHAGRVGAAAGVLPTTVAAMTALGARIETIEVLLGPAICGACYEVPEDMRAAVDAALPGSATRTRRGTPGLDIRAGLRFQLRRIGITGVGVDPRCTMEDPGLFSHRRDARTGRQAGVIWMDPAQN